MQSLHAPSPRCCGLRIVALAAYGYPASLAAAAVHSTPACIMHARSLTACILAGIETGPAGPHSMGAADLCNHLQQADPAVWKAVVAESMAGARERAVHVDDMVLQALADGGGLSVVQVGDQGLAIRLGVPALQQAAKRMAAAAVPAAMPPAPPAAGPHAQQQDPDTAASLTAPSSAYHTPCSTPIPPEPLLLDHVQSTSRARACSHAAVLGGTSANNDEDSNASYQMCNVPQPLPQRHVRTALTIDEQEAAVAACLSVWWPHHPALAAAAISILLQPPQVIERNGRNTATLSHVVQQMVLVCAGLGQSFSGYEPHTAAHSLLSSTGPPLLIIKPGLLSGQMVHLDIAGLCARVANVFGPTVGGHTSAAANSVQWPPCFQALPSLATCCHPAARPLLSSMHQKASSREGQSFVQACLWTLQRFAQPARMDMAPAGSLHHAHPTAAPSTSAASDQAQWNSSLPGAHLSGKHEPARLEALQAAAAVVYAGSEPQAVLRWLAAQAAAEQAEGPVGPYSINGPQLGIILSSNAPDAWGALPKGFKMQAAFSSIDGILHLLPWNNGHYAVHLDAAALLLAAADVPSDGFPVCSQHMHQDGLGQQLLSTALTATPPAQPLPAVELQKQVALCAAALSRWGTISLPLFVAAAALITQDAEHAAQNGAWRAPCGWVVSVMIKTCQKAGSAVCQGPYEARSTAALQLLGSEHGLFTQHGGLVQLQVRQLCAQAAEAAGGWHVVGGAAGGCSWPPVWPPALSPSMFPPHMQPVMQQLQAALSSNSDLGGNSDLGQLHLGEWLDNLSQVAGTASQAASGPSHTDVQQLQASTSQIGQPLPPFRPLDDHQQVQQPDAAGTLAAGSRCSQLALCAAALACWGSTKLPLFAAAVTLIIQGAERVQSHGWFCAPVSYVQLAMIQACRHAGVPLCEGGAQQPGAQSLALLQSAPLLHVAEGKVQLLVQRLCTQVLAAAKQHASSGTSGSSVTGSSHGSYGCWPPEWPAGMTPASFVASAQPLLQQLQAALSASGSARDGYLREWLGQLQQVGGGEEMDVVDDDEDELLAILMAGKCCA